MNRDAKRWIVAALIVIVPFVLSGCIVWDDCWWCDSTHRPPRMASFRAYVYDYRTGAPIPWAAVEVYEEEWWSWDYIGTWGVGPYGYVTANLGYVYYDGCGGCEDREFRIEAYAEGYYSEWVDIRVSYYDSHETIYFYLAPWYMRDDARDHETTGEDGLPEGEKIFEDGPGRVELGEKDRDAGPEGVVSPDVPRPGQ